MPITPASGTNRAANIDLIAALLLFTWAMRRAQKDVDPAIILKEWQELRDSYEPLAPP